MNFSDAMSNKEKNVLYRCECITETGGDRMLSYLKGDLLSSPAQVQVNTVNTVGVMGKGIALQFKNKYPAMFRSYQNVCEKHLLDVGKLYLWKSPEKWVHINSVR